MSKVKSKFKYLIFAVVLLIPFIYSFFYLKAYWDPYGNMNNIPIAIVNEDKGDKGKKLASTLIGGQSLGFQQVDKAKAEDGASWTVNGKAVLLASGGFMRNAEMIKEYYPEYVGQFFNCASASTGDGIKMGLAVGGYMECTGRALPAYLSTYASKFEIALIHHSTPGIMVNAKGDNIGNIVSDNHYKMAAAKLALDTEHGGALYYVFDDAACITNNEPMATHFYVANRDTHTLKCRYCEKEVNINDVKLL